MIDLEKIRKKYSNFKNKKQFTDAVGIKYTTYTNYVNGRTPDLETIIKISDFLGVSVDTLLGREKKEVQDTSVKLGTDQRAIIKLAEKLDDADASRAYNYILFMLDQKSKKTFENYDF